ncbi:hypothetical protein HK102_002606 [Quaeritorhiza haematococci]|nr:hypothetical protein HK102_002606 [Quaeritorhiza haematococci]
MDLEGEPMVSGGISSSGVGSSAGAGGVGGAAFGPATVLYGPRAAAAAAAAAGGGLDDDTRMLMGLGGQSGGPGGKFKQQDEKVVDVDFFKGFDDDFDDNDLSLGS